MFIIMLAGTEIYALFSYYVMNPGPAVEKTQIDEKC
jgi:hypothetical protein